MRQKEPDYNKKAIMSHLLGSVIIIFFSFLHFIIARRRFEAWIPVPTCSRSAALLKVCAVCMSRQSQILFLSDVGIFIVHAWCVTQTRPRFNVPSERRGVTTFSNTQTHRCTMPGPGIEPGPFPWKARVLTTRPLRPLRGLKSTAL